MCALISAVAYSVKRSSERADTVVVVVVVVVVDVAGRRNAKKIQRMAYGLISALWSSRQWTYTLHPAPFWTSILLISGSAVPMS